MAHRLNRAAKANKQLCRLNRAPVLAAELSTISADSSVNHAPILTVALGDVMTETAVIPLGTPLLRAALGRALMNHHKRIRPGLNSMQLKALMFSEMTMSCMGEVEGTVAEMEDARKQLRAILRECPPPEVSVQAVFTALWTKLAEHSGSTRYDIDTMNEMVGLAHVLSGHSVNLRKFQAYSHGAQAFNSEWVIGAAAREQWGNLLDLSSPDQMRAEAHLELRENDLAALAINYDEFIKYWKIAPLAFYTAFYDAEAWTDKTVHERHSIHALFTCLAHLSKGQNKTSNWIISRFKRVQEGISGLTDLDAAVVQEFSKMHAGAKLTSERIFPALAAAYKCLDDTPAASLCWVVEQAVASNITAALTIADTISKMQYFPIQAFMEELIPESEFKALIRLAMNVLVSKFCTLAGPPVTVKEYADIAYLAMAIQKKGMRANERASMNDYAGEFTQYLRINKVDLDAMAAQVQSVSASIAADKVSLRSIIRKQITDDSIIIDQEGETMIYTDVGAVTSEVEEGVLPAPQGAISRAKLPQELKRNNRYYTCARVSEVLKRAKDSETEKTKAFRFIMDELSMCGVQSSSYFQDMLSCAYQMPYSAISDGMKKALQLWLGSEAEEFIVHHPARSLNTIAAPGHDIGVTEHFPMFFMMTPLDGAGPGNPDMDDMPDDQE